MVPESHTCAWNGLHGPGSFTQRVTNRNASWDSGTGVIFHPFYVSLHLTLSWTLYSNLCFICRSFLCCHRMDPLIFCVAILSFINLVTMTVLATSFDLWLYALCLFLYVWLYLINVCIFVTPCLFFFLCCAWCSCGRFSLRDCWRP